MLTFLSDPLKGKVAQLTNPVVELEAASVI